MFDLKALVQKLVWRKNKRLTDKEEFELVCIRIGLGLFSCQLVERGLERLLRTVFATEHERQKEKGGHAMLGGMIRELQKRPNVPEDFPKIIDEFRELRNKFVHRLFDSETTDMMTHEGRMACYTMSAEVHAFATGLVKMFGNVHADYLTDLGYSWGEYLRFAASILPDVPEPSVQ